MKSRVERILLRQCQTTGRHIRKQVIGNMLGAWRKWRFITTVASNLQRWLVITKLVAICKTLWTAVRPGLILHLLRLSILSHGKSFSYSWCSSRRQHLFGFVPFVNKRRQIWRELRLQGGVFCRGSLAKAEVWSARFRSHTARCSRVPAVEELQD